MENRKAITTAMTEQTNNTGLLRLLQLVSPALPVGGFAFSHGLEYAVECAWVSDEQSASSWITGILENSLVAMDLPLLQRCYQAAENEDHLMLQRWNNIVLASRETNEFLLAEREVGRALLRLLSDLHPDHQLKGGEHGFVAAFAFAAVLWGVSEEDAMTGFAWSWAENQVSAAIKVVPLGQTAGQRILSDCIALIPGLVTRAQQVADNQIGVSLPGLSMASTLHETQYSRLFRS